LDAVFQRYHCRVCQDAGRPAARVDAGPAVTNNLRALTRFFDHFDVAEVLDFVGVDSNATIKSKSPKTPAGIDMLRSLKKSNAKTPAATPASGSSNRKPAT